ncbi:hypothetical protein K6L09_46200, partial [Burkholderia cepacia]
FMSATPATRRGKPSPLKPFEQDIKKLRESGYGLQQIVEYLKRNGVNTSVQTVSSFIRRNIEKDRPIKKRKRPQKNSVRKSQS